MSIIQKMNHGRVVFEYPEPPPLWKTRPAIRTVVYVEPSQQVANITLQYKGRCSVKFPRYTTFVWNEQPT